MNAHIFTEGGKRIGFGHVARCSSLYDALEERGLHCTLMIEGERNVEEIVAHRAFSITRWSEPDAVQSGTVRPPAVAVIDSYLAPREAYLRIAASSEVCVSIDDFDRIEYPDGIVVQCAAEPRLHTVDRSLVEYLSGPQYHLIRKEFWDIAEHERIGDDVHRVLVTLGGTSPMNLLSDVVRQVCECFKSASVEVAAGRKLEREPDFFQDSFGRVRLHGVLDAASIRDLMLSADLAVTAGGQTLFELARCGTPAVAITIAENQRQNKRGFVLRGTVADGGDIREVERTPILSRVLQGLESKDRRLAMSAVGRRLVDGRGPRRIAEAILRRVR